MRKLILFAITMLALSGLCNGQGGVENFGGLTEEDTSRTEAKVRIDAYANDENKLMSVDAEGNVGLVPQDSLLNDTLRNYQYVVNPEQFRTSEDQEETELVQAAVNWLAGVVETFDDETGNVTLDSVAPPKRGNVYLPKTYTCGRGLVKYVTHPTYGTKWVNSQIYIPLTSLEDSTQPLIQIKFIGDGPPNFLANYINPKWWLASSLTGGIKSTISHDGSYLPAVIRAVPGDTISPFGLPVAINPTDWHWENLTLIVHHDPATGTQLSGLDFYNTFQQIVRNFYIGCDTDNVNTVAPTYETFAIRSAATGTGAIQYFENGAITGAFKKGAVAFEHSIWRNVGWFVVEWPIDAGTANYMIDIDNCLVSGCPHVLTTKNYVIDPVNTASYISGSLRIESNRTANGVGGKWYSAAGKWDIVDSLNQLRGDLKVDYTNDGNQSPNGLRVYGGRQLNYNSVSRDTVGSLEAYNNNYPSGIGLRYVFRNQFAGISLGTSHAQGQAFLFVNGDGQDANVGSAGASIYLTTGASQNALTVAGVSRANLSYLATEGSASRGMAIGPRTLDSLRWMTFDQLCGGFLPDGKMFLTSNKIASGSGSDSMLVWNPSTGVVGKRPAPTGSGTVTSFSATDGNGFDFTVANATTTPTLSATLQTGFSLLNNTTQTIDGAKTFSSAVTVSSTASTIASFNSTAAANSSVFWYSAAARNMNFIMGANGVNKWYVGNIGSDNDRFSFRNSDANGNAEKFVLLQNGQAGVNTGTPAASAVLDVTSTTQGFLPPRMTAAQASAISSPAEGLMVYVTNTNGTFTAKGWWGYNGSAWEKLNN